MTLVAHMAITGAFVITCHLLSIVYFLLPACLYSFLKQPNCISGVIVSVLTSSVIDRGFESRSGQIKDYICICCFSAAHSIKQKEQRLVGSESK
jgi:hypothetical protein